MGIAGGDGMNITPIYENNVKIGRTKLRLYSGKVVKFKSKAARDRYEAVARAVKHGWKPSR